MAGGEAAGTKPRQEKQYDYLLKFLLVGDSDVGKQEILSGLEDGASESPFCSGSAYKTTTILLDGKRVKLQLWDTSGQGRFCTIIRSYSRGAQGILLVYDITNKWSFDGIDRWLKEVEEHAPGVPKVLVGNRLHLAFKRQVGVRDAEAYAAKNRMAFFEVSPLCDFNIRESFSELSRMALHRNGMERLWRSNKVLSLQELACRAIVARTTVYGIDQLPLPTSIKSHLKSYAMTTTTQLRYNGNRSQNSSKSLGSYHRKLRFVGAGHNGLTTPGNSPGSITDSRSSCAGRNSCTIS
ncbi:ras-related protein Rab-40C [Diachasma alloeum]|uniref:ras-related protein Rab-40C n=1 Tax=Diachasma alloeum TaxID=454923 RepID=UPI0007383E66|nr:ras-related protein Rab-40C [Diachasma alloeum]